MTITVSSNDGPDITSELQKAVNEAIEIHDDIALPAGEFVISETVVVASRGRGVQIRGAPSGAPSYGKAATVLRWTGPSAMSIDDADSAMIRIEAPGTRLERLTFKVDAGNRLAAAVRIQREALPGPSEGTNANDAVIENCHFLGGRSETGGAANGEMMIGLRIGRPIALQAMGDGSYAPADNNELNLEHQSVIDCLFETQSAAGLAVLPSGNQAKLNRIVRCHFTGEKTRSSAQEATLLSRILRSGLSGVDSYRAIEDLVALHTADDITAVKAKSPYRYDGFSLDRADLVTAEAVTRRLLVNHVAQPQHSSAYLNRRATADWTGLYQDVRAAIEGGGAFGSTTLTPLRPVGIYGNGSFSATACTFNGLTAGISLQALTDAILVEAADSEACDALLRVAAGGTNESTPITLLGSRGSRGLSRDSAGAVEARVCPRYVNVGYPGPMTIIGSFLQGGKQAAGDPLPVLRVGTTGSSNFTVIGTTFEGFATPFSPNAPTTISVREYGG